MLNAHDPHHRDEDWKDDSDAYSLPEGEAESESKIIYYLSVFIRCPSTKYENVF